MTVTMLGPTPTGRTAAAGPLAATARTSRLFDPTRLWGQADPAVEMSVVVPFYNPGTALRTMVLGLVECLRAEGMGFEVIAVSDGSTDGSERSLDGIGAEVRVIVNPVNEGKGAALHLGFGAARGAWVGFIDADGDIAPRHLVEYLRLARQGGNAGVYADKRHALSTSGATGFRKIVSLMYSTFVTLLFFMGVRDTQTGCKIFRRDVLRRLLPALRERRFAFDLEFFVAAKAAGVSDLVAAPVRLEPRVAGSTVTVRSILRTVRDTLAVFARLHLRRQYTAAVAVPPAPVAPISVRRCVQGITRESLPTLPDGRFTAGAERTHRRRTFAGARLHQPASSRRCSTTPPATRTANASDDAAIPRRSQRHGTYSTVTVPAPARTAIVPATVARTGPAAVRQPGDHSSGSTTQPGSPGSTRHRVEPTRRSAPWAADGNEPCVGPSTSTASLPSCPRSARATTSWYPPLRAATTRPVPGASTRYRSSSGERNTGRRSRCRSSQPYASASRSRASTT
jgi:hypothetical protein